METAEQKKYKEYVAQKAPKSRLLYDCFKAFWVGGLICVIGEAISMLFLNVFEMEKTAAASWTSIVLVFLGATLTGIGVYDKIGKYAGAGSVVPITGFANSVASSAIEYKAEGQVFGIGCKIFTIAGPVILYGILSSWILGVIYYLFTMIP